MYLRVIFQHLGITSLIKDSPKKRSSHKSVTKEKKRTENRLRHTVGTTLKSAITGTIIITTIIVF